MINRLEGHRMPIYVYRCQTCGEEFEKFFLSQRLAQGEVVCPACQGKEVERLPALFGVGGGTTRSTASAASCAPSGGG